MVHEEKVKNDVMEKIEVEKTEVGSVVYKDSIKIDEIPVQSPISKEHNYIVNQPEKENLGTEIKLGKSVPKKRHGKSVK